MSDKASDKSAKESQKTVERNLKQAAKKYLKTMRHNNAHHPMRNKGRVMKYGASGFSRNIWLSTAATAVMAITLIILFVTVVASVVLNSTADLMREKIDITVYLKPNTSQTVLDELEEIMLKDPNVRSVETATSEEEYQKFLAENADSDDLLEILDEDLTAIMISEMQATMRVKVYDTDNLDSIKYTVENDPLFVKYVDQTKAPTYDVNQAEIATITSWANIARTGGIILCIVFLVISVLIIFSTIRMAIFSRREEIYMMKLVGAEKSFIRGPFLVEAEICGLIAGLLAATVSYFGFEFVAPRLTGYGIDVSIISDVLNSSWLIVVFLAFVALGVIIGRISARLAVSKYLHKT